MDDLVLDFRLGRDAEGDSFWVELAAGEREVRGGFAFDFEDRQLIAILQRIESNHCPIDDLKEIGVRLWGGLMTGAVGELFASVRSEHPASRCNFRLSLQDPQLELLPWEALYFDDFEEGFGFLSCHPSYSVVRAPVARLDSSSSLRPVHDKLKILAAIPVGSGLDAEREWRHLELAVERVRDRVQLVRLAGRVTPDALADRLSAEPWDVFHFIGHGEQTDSGRTVVRLNGEDGAASEQWLDGEAFANLFFHSGVRLAVLNCCQGAMPAPNRRMSGLGPFFLRAGVPAVVAMRYEIEDRAAIRFSQRFYQDLLGGREPGRADLAVESAREALHRNQPEDAARPFVTPVLFLAGRSKLFDIAPAGSVAPVAVTAAVPRIEVPPRLIRALVEGRCVPVIGPRVLTASPVRSGSPTSDARHLAKTLGQHFGYSRARDFELCEAAGDWMDAILLQWVCQLAQKSREFFELTEAIQNAYRSSKPPASLTKIAEWSIPAAFYLYFDGLLEEAFEARRRPVRVVQSVDASVPAGDHPLLIHVRGSHRDAQSLALTEEDHDLLWDRIGRMSLEITNLVRGHLGRSLLFLGASPRDPLVKRLFSKLAENWSERSRGPIFFLCTEEEKGDPYWERHNVHWITEDLDDFVSAVTEQARQGGAS